ncbi:MAG: DNA ligase D [Proteobacteria bacterium]|nr:DNA ligase D [Pseudomonadota bacterium]
MTLKEYRRKRDFKKSKEPPGKKTTKKNPTPSYVMHKHAAKRLHYDLRLEMEGVLKSWAVPKGPSLDPSVKRLAVQVEDHPLEYGEFEGVIPKGEYGGGTVMLWDRGSWVKEIKQGNDKDSITFTLNGSKLKGKWKLIKIKKDPKNWLLIKVDDKFAKNGSYDITKEKPLSDLSGKALDQIHQDANYLQKKNKKKVQNNKITKMLEKLPVEQTKIPARIYFELPTLVKSPPEGKQWLHEIKYDGYRLLCIINREIKLITRNQLNWSSKFPGLINEINKLGLNNTVLDGEVVAIDSKNQPSFQALQQALSENKTHHLVYYVFDLLYYHNYDLTHLDLLTRKKVLQALLGESGSLIKYSDHIIGQGGKVFENAKKLSFEGIVSKDIHSVYVQKRSKSWLKTKCLHRQEFVVIGFTHPLGGRSYFGALLLGYYTEDNQLKYAGRVGTGFDDAQLKIIFDLLEKYKTTKSPLSESLEQTGKINWVKPKLVVEVEFREWTTKGIIRQPSFKGIREDKTARQVSADKIEDESFEKTGAVKTKKIVLSNPSKILYPENGITKLQLAQYYTQISEKILPYITHRPLTLLRCPNGVDDKCFYQKHLNQKDNVGHLFSVKIPGDKRQDYIYIKNEQGLIELVQMGVLEIHPWLCRVDNIKKPDMIIFDLDPGTDVPFKDIVKAAFLLKEELENYQLVSFVKTTGKKGLHIVVPIQRRYDWEVTTHFAKTFVNYLAIKYPTLFIKTMSKLKRQGKIFIDYLRNNKGATAVAPFSTRATGEGTIAMPLAWDQVSQNLNLLKFNINNLNAHKFKITDPWQDFYKLKQSLPRVSDA